MPFNNKLNLLNGELKKRNLLEVRFTINEYFGYLPVLHLSKTLKEIYSKSLFLIVFDNKFEASTLNILNFLIKFHKDEKFSNLTLQNELFSIKNKFQQLFKEKSDLIFIMATNSEPYFQRLGIKIFEIHSPKKTFTI